MKSTSAARVIRHDASHAASTARRTANHLRDSRPGRVRVPEPDQSGPPRVYRAIYPCGIDTRSRES